MSHPEHRSYGSTFGSSDSVWKKPVFSRNPHQHHGNTQHQSTYGGYQTSSSSHDRGNWQPRYPIRYNSGPPRGTGRMPRGPRPPMHRLVRPPAPGEVRHAPRLPPHGPHQPRFPGPAAHHSTNYKPSPGYDDPSVIILPKASVNASIEVYFTSNSKNEPPSGPGPQADAPSISSSRPRGFGDVPIHPHPQPQPYYDHRDNYRGSRDCHTPPEQFSTSQDVSEGDRRNFYPDAINRHPSDPPDPPGLSGSSHPWSFSKEPPPAAHYVTSTIGVGIGASVDFQSLRDIFGSKDRDDRFEHFNTADINRQGDPHHPSASDPQESYTSHDVPEIASNPTRAFHDDNGDLSEENVLSTKKELVPTLLQHDLPRPVDFDFTSFKKGPANPPSIETSGLEVGHKRSAVVDQLMASLTKQIDPTKLVGSEMESVLPSAIESFVTKGDYETIIRNSSEKHESNPESKDIVHELPKKREKVFESVINSTGVNVENIASFPQHVSKDDQCVTDAAPSHLSGTAAEAGEVYEDKQAKSEADGGELLAIPLSDMESTGRAERVSGDHASSKDREASTRINTDKSVNSGRQLHAYSGRGHAPETQAQQANANAKANGNRKNKNQIRPTSQLASDRATGDGNLSTITADAAPSNPAAVLPAVPEADAPGPHHTNQHSSLDAEPVIRVSPRATGRHDDNPSERAPPKQESLMLPSEPKVDKKDSAQSGRESGLIGNPPTNEAEEYSDLYRKYLEKRKTTSGKTKSRKVKGTRTKDTESTDADAKVNDTSAERKAERKVVRQKERKVSETVTKDTQNQLKDVDYRHSGEDGQLRCPSVQVPVPAADGHHGVHSAGHRKLDKVRQKGRSHKDQQKPHTYDQSDVKGTMLRSAAQICENETLGAGLRQSVPPLSRSTEHVRNAAGEGGYFESKGNPTNWKKSSSETRSWIPEIDKIANGDHGCKSKRENGKPKVLKEKKTLTSEKVKAEKKQPQAGNGVEMAPQVPTGKQTTDRNPSEKVGPNQKSHKSSSREQSSRSRSHSKRKRDDKETSTSNKRSRSYNQSKQIESKEQPTKDEKSANAKEKTPNTIQTDPAEEKIQKSAKSKRSGDKEKSRKTSSAKKSGKSSSKDRCFEQVQEWLQKHLLFEGESPPKDYEQMENMLSPIPSSASHEDEDSPTTKELERHAAPKAEQEDDYIPEMAAAVDCYSPSQATTKTDTYAPEVDDEKPPDIPAYVPTPLDQLKESATASAMDADSKVKQVMNNGDVKESDGRDVTERKRFKSLGRSKDKNRKKSSKKQSKVSSEEPCLKFCRNVPDMTVDNSVVEATPKQPLYQSAAQKKSPKIDALDAREMSHDATDDIDLFSYPSANVGDSENRPFIDPEEEGLQQFPEDIKEVKKDEYRSPKRKLKPGQSPKESSEKSSSKSPRKKDSKSKKRDKKSEASHTKVRSKASPKTKRDHPESDAYTKSGQVVWKQQEVLKEERIPNPVTNIEETSHEHVPEVLSENDNVFYDHRSTEGQNNESVKKTDETPSEQTDAPSAPTQDISKLNISESDAERLSKEIDAKIAELHKMKEMLFQFRQPSTDAIVVKESTVPERSEEVKVKKSPVAKPAQPPKMSSPKSSVRTSDDSQKTKQCRNSVTSAFNANVVTKNQEIPTKQRLADLVDKSSVTRSEDASNVSVCDSWTKSCRVRGDSFSIFSVKSPAIGSDHLSGADTLTSPSMRSDSLKGSPHAAGKSDRNVFDMLTSIHDSDAFTDTDCDKPALNVSKDILIVPSDDDAVPPEAAKCYISPSAQVTVISDSVQKSAKDVNSNDKRRYSESSNLSWTPSEDFSDASDENESSVNSFKPVQKKLSVKKSIQNVKSTKLKKLKKTVHSKHDKRVPSREHSQNKHYTDATGGSRVIGETKDRKKRRRRSADSFINHSSSSSSDEEDKVQSLQDSPGHPSDQSSIAHSNIEYSRELDQDDLYDELKPDHSIRDKNGQEETHDKNFRVTYQSDQNNASDSDIDHNDQGMTATDHVLTAYNVSENDIYHNDQGMTAIDLVVKADNVSDNDIDQYDRGMTANDHVVTADDVFDNDIDHVDQRITVTDHGVKADKFSNAEGTLDCPDVDCYEGKVNIDSHNQFYVNDSDSAKAQLEAAESEEHEDDLLNYEYDDKHHSDYDGDMAQYNNDYERESQSDCPDKDTVMDDSDVGDKLSEIFEDNDVSSEEGGEMTCKESGVRSTDYTFASALQSAYSEARQSQENDINGQDGDHSEDHYPAYSPGHPVDAECPFGHSDSESPTQKDVEERYEGPAECPLKNICEISLETKSQPEELSPQQLYPQSPCQPFKSYRLRAVTPVSHEATVDTATSQDDYLSDSALFGHTNDDHSDDRANDDDDINNLYADLNLTTDDDEKPDNDVDNDTVQSSDGYVSEEDGYSHKEAELQSMELKDFKANTVELGCALASGSVNEPAHSSPTAKSGGTHLHSSPAQAQANPVSILERHQNEDVMFMHPGNAHINATGHASSMLLNSQKSSKPEKDIGQRQHCVSLGENKKNDLLFHSPVNYTKVVTSAKGQSVSCAPGYDDMSNEAAAESEGQTRSKRNVKSENGSPTHSHDVDSADRVCKHKGGQCDKDSSSHANLAERDMLTTPDLQHELQMKDNPEWSEKVQECANLSGEEFDEELRKIYAHAAAFCSPKPKHIEVHISRPVPQVHHQDYTTCDTSNHYVKDVLDPDESHFESSPCVSLVNMKQDEASHSSPKEIIGNHSSSKEIDWSSHLIEKDEAIVQRHSSKLHEGMTGDCNNGERDDREGQVDRERQQVEKTEDSPTPTPVAPGSPKYSGKMPQHALAQPSHELQSSDQKHIDDCYQVPHTVASNFSAQEFSDSDNGEEDQDNYEIVAFNKTNVATSLNYRAENVQQAGFMESPHPTSDCEGSVRLPTTLEPSSEHNGPHMAVTKEEAPLNDMSFSECEGNVATQKDSLDHSAGHFPQMEDNSNGGHDYPEGPISPLPDKCAEHEISDIKDCNGTQKSPVHESENETAEVESDNPINQDNDRKLLYTADKQSELNDELGANSKLRKRPKPRSRRKVSDISKGSSRKRSDSSSSGSSCSTCSSSSSSSSSSGSSSSSKSGSSSSGSGRSSCSRSSIASRPRQVKRKHQIKAIRNKGRGSRTESQCIVPDVEKDLPADINDVSNNHLSKCEVPQSPNSVRETRPVVCDRDELAIVSDSKQSINEEIAIETSKTQDDQQCSTDLVQPPVEDTKSYSDDVKLSGSNQISTGREEKLVENVIYTDTEDAEVTDDVAASEVSNKRGSSLEVSDVMRTDNKEADVVQNLDRSRFSESKDSNLSQGNNCDIIENNCTNVETVNLSNSDSVEKVTAADKDNANENHENEMNKAHVTVEDHTSGTGAVNVTGVVPATRKKIQIKLTSCKAISQLYDDLEDHEINFTPSYESDFDEESTKGPERPDDQELKKQLEKLETRKGRDRTSSSSSGSGSNSSGSGSSSSGSDGNSSSSSDSSSSSSDSSDEEDNTESKDGQKSRRDGATKGSQQEQEGNDGKRRRITRSPNKGRTSEKDVKETKRKRDKDNIRSSPLDSQDTNSRGERSKGTREGEYMPDSRNDRRATETHRSSKKLLHETETVRGSGREEREKDIRRDERGRKDPPFDVTDEDIIQANNDSLTGSSKGGGTRGDRYKDHAKHPNEYGSNNNKSMSTQRQGRDRDSQDRISSKPKDYGNIRSDRDNRSGSRKRPRSSSEDEASNERSSKRHQRDNGGGDGERSQRNQRSNERERSSKSNQKDNSDKESDRRPTRDKRDNDVDEKGRTSRRNQRDNENERERSYGRSKRDHGEVSNGNSPKRSKKDLEGENERASRKRDYTSSRSGRSHENLKSSSHSSRSRGSEERLTSQRHNRDVGRRSGADSRPEVKRGKYDHATGGSRYSGRPEYCLYVNNLEREVNDRSLYQFFAKYFKTVKNAKVVVDSRGRSRGCGCVKFYDETEQQRALIEAQHSLALGKKPLRLSLHRSSSSSHVSPESHRSGRHSDSRHHRQEPSPSIPLWNFPPPHYPPPFAPPPSQVSSQTPITGSTNVHQLVLEYWSEEEDPELIVNVKKFNADFMYHNEELYNVLGSSRWNLTTEMIEQATILDTLDTMDSD